VEVEDAEAAIPSLKRIPRLESVYLTRRGLESAYLTRVGITFLEHGDLGKKEAAQVVRLRRIMQAALPNVEIITSVEEVGMGAD
jgi:hypothetical protein